MKHVFAMVTMACLLVPGIADAHTGIGETTGFFHGFVHPVVGSDHLLAMVAVGLWAACLGGRALWSGPVVFTAAMVAGGALAFAGMDVPFVEQGILLSVLVFGFFAAGALKLPVVYSSVLVAFFALFHGHAHGSEIPATAGALMYTAGFAVSTLLLCSVGISLGLFFQKIGSGKLGRLIGGLIMLCGAVASLS